MSPKVIQVQPLAEFKLRLFFENGEVRCFDVTPYLDRGVFTELKQLHYFQQVSPFFGGVQWPHEQDFSADTLYLKSTADQAWNVAQTRANRRIIRRPKPAKLRMEQEPRLNAMLGTKNLPTVAKASSREIQVQNVGYTTPAGSGAAPSDVDSGGSGFT